MPLHPVVIGQISCRAKKDTSHMHQLAEREIGDKDAQQKQVHEDMKSSFSNPYYSIFYIIALFFLAFHLVHGFQSAFQSLGIRHDKYTAFIKKFGIIFSILLCAGFALIPLYFLFNTGGN